jgi:hypothetical protein
MGVDLGAVCETSRIDIPVLNSSINDLELPAEYRSEVIVRCMVGSWYNFWMQQTSR